MNVIAIDPGPKASTHVTWDMANKKVVAAADLPNEQMLDFLRQGHPGCHCAIEMVESFGMAVGAAVFETVFWIGRYYQVASDVSNGYSMQTALIYRKEVKMWLCQSMRAKDGNIRQALIDRYGALGTKKAPGPLYGMAGHKWSALAIAVTYADHLDPQNR